MYFGLSSMRMALRPSSRATWPVVPDPAKGSHTTQGTVVLSPHLQVGCQPRVFAGLYVLKAASPTCFCRCPIPESSAWSCHDAPIVPPFASPKTLSQGAPHFGQQPLALVPARMQGLIKSSGKVAKCDSGYAWLGTVQTVRLFRPDLSPLVFQPLPSFENPKSCLSLRAPLAAAVVL